MPDLVDLLEQKRFLGQEFLTWLWYKSEERGGTVYLPSEGDVVLIFERHMLLEYGEGEGSESLICRGLYTELQEARTGLLMGKKIEQARIRLGRGNFEWHLTLRATMLDISGMRLPKSFSPAEDAGEEGGSEARILDRIGMVEEAVRTINELFRLFLKIRVDALWDTDELPKIRSWTRKAGLSSA